MERLLADPAKLLASWMEWERGEMPPGKVLSELKRGGMRELLEDVIHSRAELEAFTAGSEGEA